MDIVLGLECFKSCTCSVEIHQVPDTPDARSRAVQGISDFESNDRDPKTHQDVEDTPKTSTAHVVSAVSYRILLRFLSK